MRDWRCLGSNYFQSDRDSQCPPPGSLESLVRSEVKRAVSQAIKVSNQEADWRCLRSLPAPPASPGETAWFRQTASPGSPRSSPRTSPGQPGGAPASSCENSGNISYGRMCRPGKIFNINIHINMRVGVVSVFTRKKVMRSVGNTKQTKAVATPVM